MAQSQEVPMPAKADHGAAQEDTSLPGVDAVANGHSELPVEQENDAVVKLYFVRVPRPPMDDAKLKTLQADFQAHIAEIKGINARLAAKRDVVREFRGQVSQARSLKGSSQPEFEEKLNRLKQLRDLKNGYISQIMAIKGNVKGLECRSEAEMDAKIKELEEKIRFGTIPLREEKNVVNEISKLRSQRDKVKDFEVQKSSLVELESECAKVKATIKELDGEFGIIKGERDAATDALSSIYVKLKAAEKEAEKVEDEQKEAVDKKNQALEALEAARKEIDNSMVDYKENRKFSLQVRDMVAVGQVEEAQELCAKQIGEMMARLNSDTAFRSEYCQLWASQRRFAVSEVLPESSAAAVAAAAAAKQPTGKDGKGDKAGAPAARPVARGAEKAASLIASIMQQASAEANRVKSGAPRTSESDVEEEEPEPVAASAIPSKPAAPAKPTAAPKLVQNPAAKAAEVFNFKVEVPQVNDEVFVPPVAKAEPEAVTKEQVREEQRQKAAEAELRKKRQAEMKDKKRSKAVELQKKAEDDEREAKAAAALAAQQQAQAAAQQRAEAAAAAAVVEAAEAEQAAAAKELAVGRGIKSAAASASTPYKLVAPAAKRPAGKAGLLKQVKKIYQQNQVMIAVAAVVLLIILILIAASFY